MNIKAPAKVNVALSVGPPGSNGMHPICSWMITVDLCDEMELTALEPNHLSRYAILWHDEARQRHEINWPIKSDLAVRAHLALEQYVKRSLPVQLKLEKRIPLGGGLGGGSSDAAAMLRGINTLFELDLTDQVLEGISASLGSDVPFLVRGGSAIVEGAGELVEHLDESPLFEAVLILPGVACDTAAVYQQLDASGPTPVDAGAVRELVGASVDGNRLFNDLADPALEVANRLRDDRQAISELVDAPVHISGSGSTMFVVCRDALESEAMARAIETETGLAAVRVSAAPAELGIVDRFIADPGSG